MVEKLIDNRSGSVQGTAAVGQALGVQNSQIGGSSSRLSVGAGRNAVSSGQFGKWRVLGAPKLTKQDEKTATKPRLIMVYGAPLSGKTSFAEKFSATFKAPFINLEALLTEHRIGSRTSGETVAAAIEIEKPAKQSKRAKKVADKKKSALDEELAKYLGNELADQESLSDDVMAEAQKEFSDDGANDLFVEEANVNVSNSDFTEYEKEVISRTALSILEGIFKSKQTILLEGGVSTFAERSALQDMAIEAGYNPLVLWIQTDLTTIKQRLAKLPPAEQMTRSEFESEIAKLETPTAAEAPIVISGKHTFDTQMRTVLGQLAKAR
jgi:gluconate kinase